MVLKVGKKKYLLDELLYVVINIEKCDAKAGPWRLSLRNVTSVHNIGQSILEGLCAKAISLALGKRGIRKWGLLGAFSCLTAPCFATF